MLQNGFHGNIYGEQGITEATATVRLTSKTFSRVNVSNEKPFKYDFYGKTFPRLTEFSKLSAGLVKNLNGTASTKDILRGAKFGQSNIVVQLNFKTFSRSESRNKYYKESRHDSCSYGQKAFRKTYFKSPREVVRASTIAVVGRHCTLQSAPRHNTLVEEEEEESLQDSGVGAVTSLHDHHSRRGKQARANGQPVRNGRLKPSLRRVISLVVAGFAHFLNGFAPSQGVAFGVL